LIAALFAAACSDAVGPGRKHLGPGGPLFSYSPNGITLGPVNGSLSESGTQLAKGFDPKNPHHGDAVIAMVFWLGSSSVDSVVDFVASTPNTRVGNTYHLIDYVTTGGYSMATYVATNIQNFPDTSSVSGQILAVRAYLSQSVSDGGIAISAWTGVEDNFAVALGPDHFTATGSDTGFFAAHTAPIRVNAGAVAVTVTMGAVDTTKYTGVSQPSGFARVGPGRGSDKFILEDAGYQVQASAGTVDPQWTWGYEPPARPWLVSTFSLNAASSTNPPPNQSPIAAFTSSCSNLSCSFTNTSSDPDGSIAANSWNFGDGQTSTVASPSHSYGAAGTYTVTLTVTDNQGATNTVSHSVTVTAANQSPTAAFTSSCSNLTCSFTSTSSDPDGSISANSWNFGDGQTSTAASPSHTYGAAGTYTVTLTVTDNQGATNSVSHSVTVSPANQSPTAAFSSSCSGDACTFTNTSSDPDGSIASNSWNFGDGQTSTTVSPSHTYTASGTYTVTLTVTDNQGATNSVSHNVTVNRAPTAAFSSSCTNLSCSFTNTSSDPDGSISTNNWTFGDGQTSTAASPSHIYGAAGTYTVTLTVSDNQGATNSVSHSVTVTAPNQPPTANFTFSCSALSCNFTSTSSDPDGSIASYSWTFGDGGTSTAANPSHAYTAAGSYTVSLRVTDNQGAQSTTTSKTVTVTAPNQPPTANFTFSCSALSCNFTSTSSDPDGSIASYSWTFGDGATSTAQNPSHVYAAGGTYTASLRVTDNQGAQSTTTSKSVTVTAPNSPPVVNAGPDQTAVTGLLYSSTQSFSDANGNGPWSYRIDWGDGSVSTGTRTTQGSFTVGHTYAILLPRSFTITVRVTDAAGATGSDTKVVSVLLL